ncbi:transposase [Streptomyces sp. NPDC006335]|uniref:transposase n=1 Tax=Streptomyces sp. NPDC006335 TaxID=3156895 RepID=UPI0033AB0275
MAECTSWSSLIRSTRRTCAASSPGSLGTSTGRSAWSSTGTRPTSKVDRDWLADDKDHAELHFLPSYSPELNPDELVNADLEGNLPHIYIGPGASRTRRPDTPVLPPPTTPGTHRARTVRRSARPLGPRRENRGNART